MMDQRRPTNSDSGSEGSRLKEAPYLDSLQKIRKTKKKKAGNEGAERLIERMKSFRSNRTIAVDGMTNQSPVTLGTGFGGAKSEDVSHMGGSFRIKPNAMSIAESEMT